MLSLFLVVTSGGVSRLTKNIFSLTDEKNIQMLTISRVPRPYRPVILGTNKSDMSVLPTVDLTIGACCTFCRDSPVSLDADLSVRTCDYCHAVQDFLLPPCPHPKCADKKPVGTWELRGAPATMVHRHFFCTAEEADDMFSVPSSIRIFLDSQEEAIIENNASNVQLAMYYTVQHFIDYMLETCAPLFEQGGASEALKREYVVCIDDERRPAAQLNVLHNDSLLFLEIQRHNGMNKGIIIFEASEYAHQCEREPLPPLFSLVLEKEEEEKPLKFVIEEAPTARTIKWLKDRGLTGRRLTERGTEGPRMANEPFAVVVLTTEAITDKLLAAGYNPAMICPYLINNSKLAIIVSVGTSADKSVEAIQNVKHTQQVVCGYLTEAYLRSTDTFIKYMIEYQREYGSGTFVQTTSGNPSQYVVDVDVPLVAMEVEEEHSFGPASKQPLIKYDAHEGGYYLVEEEPTAKRVVLQEEEEESYEPDDGIPKKAPRSRPLDEYVDDEEDEYEEEEVKPKKASRNRVDEEDDGTPQKKRTRTPTSAPTIKDLCTKFNFSDKNSKKMVRFVKKQGTSVSPFAVEGRSKTGFFYVCVPLSERQAADIPEKYLTCTCYFLYRLAMVKCDSANHRDSTLNFLLPLYGKPGFTEHLNTALTME